MQVFQQRTGVCQDFAHLQIACLRSIGLAALCERISRTPPPAWQTAPGGSGRIARLAKRVGGGEQWVDFDPTNNVIPSGDHLTVAYGRDYADVCPIQGVFVGGGQHQMTVSVDVEAVE